MQGKGYSRQLIAFAEQEAMRRGFSALHLCTNVLMAVAADTAVWRRNQQWIRHHIRMIPEISGARSAANASESVTGRAQRAPVPAPMPRSVHPPHRTRGSGGGTEALEAALGMSACLRLPAYGALRGRYASVSCRYHDNQ